MRISGRNLNKKDENPSRRNNIPIYQQPSYYQQNHYPPPVVKRKSTGLKAVIVILCLALLIPVAFVAIGIVSAVAIPSLLSSRKAANEATAVSNLRTFHTAQATYYASTDESKYGSFEELAKAQLIDSDHFSRPNSQYSYNLTMNAAKTRYCLVATPKDSQNAPNAPIAPRTFGISPDGVVNYSDRGIGCANGELRGEDLKPVK